MSDERASLERAPALPDALTPRAAPVETAPDGMQVTRLGAVGGASMARFDLPEGRVARAVKHRTVSEIWVVVEGTAKLWRRFAEREDIVTLAPGVALTIHPETCFQVRTAAHALSVVATTCPSWPGDEEARVVAGPWQPTVSRDGDNGPSSVSVRAAQLHECEALSALALRAKAYWGYTEAFLEACRAELAVKPEHLERTRVASRGPVPVGYYALETVENCATELDALFVEPLCIGSGIGKRLLADARLSARALGAKRMLIQANPGAAPFYCSQGARQVGQRPSGSIPGRLLPLLELNCEVGLG